MPNLFRCIRVLHIPLVMAVAGCERPAARPLAQNPASTCSGTWPSYWQDPAFAKSGMWDGQQVSNTPTSQRWAPSNPAYTNPPFRLADAYATGQADDPRAQTWRDSRFDALFQANTPEAERAKLAYDYGWALMRYIQYGNIDSADVNADWNLCANARRQWFNMPFQTYDVLSGREFIHGLTREAPVVYSVASRMTPLGTTVWAVAFFNGNAASTLARVWRPSGAVAVPTDNLRFAEGTVIGKLLFTTATPAVFPFLTNVPQWTANISIAKPSDPNPTYCTALPNSTMPEQSTACPRSPGSVTLLQFDVAVEDSRSPIGWVYGTFVADGQYKATEPNPWDRISLLGLMWGNDPPPIGQLASTYPVDPRTSGFRDGVVEWDVVDRLNATGGAEVVKRPGHLGCNSRLNGPADNAQSSCISCHMTASVPDRHEIEPPLLAQFNEQPLTPQCAATAAPPTEQRNQVTFAEMDRIYFSNTHSASPINMSVNGRSVIGAGVPTYENGEHTWRSTDFSLQVSIALAQWMEWRQQAASLGTAAQTNNAAMSLMARTKRAVRRIFRAKLPQRQQPDKH